VMEDVSVLQVIQEPIAHKNHVKIIAIIEEFVLIIKCACVNLFTRETHVRWRFKIKD